MTSPVFPNDPTVIPLPTDDRDAWLEARRGGVGGSDVAKLAGTSKWGNAGSIYFEKINGSSDDGMSEKAESGLRMEKGILEWGADKLSMLLLDDVPALLADREYPWRRASLDGAVYAGPLDDYPAAIVDAKNVGGFHTETTLRDAYTDQMQLYMGITGVHHSYLVCLIAGQHLEIIPVEWDEERYQYLGDLADRFWTDHVLPELAPPDGSFPMHPDMVKRMYPGDPEAPNFTVSDEDEAQMLADLAEYRDLKTREREVGSRLDEVKARMQVVMGNNEVAYIGLNKAAAWRVIHTTRIDKGILEREHPIALEAATVTSTFRRFTVPAKKFQIQ